MTKKFIKKIDLHALPHSISWILLIIITAIVAFVLTLLQIPAVLLLGPMIAAILLAVSNSHIKIANPIFTMAQGVVGCMIASVITTDILKEILIDWPLFIGGVISVILVSTFIGYILAKKQILPGTTAIWGSSPGAATTMVVMAQDFGADERLVAVMQYLRVALVALTASILARFLTPTTNNTIHHIDWFASFDLFWFAITLIVAFGGSIISRKLHIPAGGILLPFVIAVILSNTGLMQIVLPPWLLAGSYLIIGWTIGLRFSRKILLHALKALPVLFIATISLIAICSGLAILMCIIHDTDFLTAYLATSPGGADSVSIIAASTAVNLPFVMAFQVTRFIIVTLTSPMISRFIANRIDIKQDKL